MDEIWLPVVGYESYYEVSNIGRVRSKDRLVRTGGRTAVRRGKMLSPYPVKGYKSNYMALMLTVNKKRKRHKIHHLVLEAFVGPRPDGTECCHHDDNPFNNHLDNLRWDTHSANMLDQSRNGRNPHKNKTHCVNGHEYNEENTYLTKKGRACRSCHRAYTKAYESRKKAGHVSVQEV